MTNSIDKLPRPRTFGKNFPYEANKNKYLSKASFHRVMWDQSYKDVVWFADNAELNTYLDSRPKFQFDNLSYMKMGEPVTIDVAFNQVIQWNYVRVQNFVQPINSSTPDKLMDYYYFITDVQYVAPNSTRVVLQLDVWQTYVRTIVFGDAYVEQGHVGVAENKAVAGEDNLLLTPEGFNLGQDYRAGNTLEHNLSFGANSVICVTSASDLTAEYGDVDDPKLVSATGSLMEDLPNGANIYFFANGGKFVEYMAATRNQSWVTQAIVSITMLPIDSSELVASKFDSITLNGVQAFTAKPGAKFNVRNISFGLRKPIAEWMPARYQKFKKFTVYPYCFFEVSTYTGEPLVLKNELFSGDSIDMRAYTHAAPPAPRIGIVPVKYNASDGSDGEMFNVAAWISNFPQFSVVNNGYMNVLASQAHSLSQSYKSADWAQQRALAGAQTSYDQASAGIGLANEMNQAQVSAMQQQTNLQNTTTTTRAIKDSAFAIGTGAMSGARAGLPGMGAGALSGAISAASTGIDAAISINQNTQSSNIAQNLARQQTQAQTGNMAYVRDSNIDLARFGAKGDYQNAMAVINAKVEDAKLTQPSTAGTTGGDAFILAMQGWKVVLKVKHIPLSAADAIADQWTRYGYAVNRYSRVPSGLKVMTTFSYWKCKEVYIRDARCPETVKRAISGILEKGVTVWHDVNSMSLGSPRAVYNEPIPGDYVR